MPTHPKQQHGIQHRSVHLWCRFSFQRAPTAGPELTNLGIVRAPCGHAGEKGTNRIGASRLQQLGKILEVPAAYFFEGAPGGREPAGSGEGVTANNFLEFLGTRDGQSLVGSFSRIADARLRRSTRNRGRKLLQLEAEHLRYVTVANFWMKAPCPPWVFWPGSAQRRVCFAGGRRATWGCCAGANGMGRLVH
jgi:hypothetical protein